MYEKNGISISIQRLAVAKYNKKYYDANFLNYDSSITAEHIKDQIIQC